MSKLESMMEAARAEETPASPEAPGEASPESVPPPEGGASTEASGDAEKPEAPAEKPALDKAAARFAALARQQQRNLDQQRQIEGASRQLQAKEREIQGRESSIATRLAEADKLLADPEALLGHLEKKLGVRSIEDLQKYAQKAWAAPAKPAEEQDPAKRPLTRAELEQWEQQRAARDHAARAAAEFARLSADDTKYEAAALLYTDEERVRHGERIAGALQARGISFKLEDVADAVDELARQDPRYAKLQARAAKSGAIPKTKSAPASAPSAAPEPNGRQGSQARTLSNDAATERANGAPRRLSHKERLQQLMRR